MPTGSPESHPADHSLVRTQTLLGELKIEEHTLLQRVHRIRRTLEAHFLASIDYSIDQGDFIQSERWHGYRPNPYLAMVRAGGKRAQ